jgi:hypothetical protein
MKISGVSPRSRDPRYAYDKPVRLNAGDNEFGQRMEGTVRDVSLSGVAVSMGASVVENGQFVNMHIEGMGSITGSVARVYEGGAAIAFEDDEDVRKRVAATLLNLNQLA